MAPPRQSIMRPVWWKLIKICLLLFALFATIVCINSEISKRREAEAIAAAAVAAAAAASERVAHEKGDAISTALVENNLLKFMQKQAQAAQDGDKLLNNKAIHQWIDHHQQSQNHQANQPNQQELGRPVEVYSEEQVSGKNQGSDEDVVERAHSIFIISDDPGLKLFNTTFTDDAPFMPISAMLGDQPPTSTVPQLQQHEQQQQPKSKILTKSKAKPKVEHYHEYANLKYQEQAFKVQRSPDGKLSLVFNDPFVSLQHTQAHQPGEKQHVAQPGVQPPGLQQVRPPRKPTSDTSKTNFLTSFATGKHKCNDGFNQSRSFCTDVLDYPDLSGLAAVLKSNYSKFFNDEQFPTGIGVRIDEPQDEVDLCKPNVRHLYPRMGPSVDSGWEIIVNTEEFKQGILVEECENQGGPCQFTDSFPNNYKTKCKQSYITRHLATVNSDASGKPELANKLFRIPSCCKCVLQVAV